MSKKVVILNVEDSKAARPWGDAKTVTSIRDILERHGMSIGVGRYSDRRDDQWLNGQELDLVIPNGHCINGSPDAPLLVDVLEARGLPFLGHSSAVFSTLSDKFQLKMALIRAGISTPSWSDLNISTFPLDCNFSEYPAVIKPRKGSDSRNVFYAGNVEEATHILTETYDSHFGPPIIEKWCRHREFTVAIVGNPPTLTVAALELDCSDSARILTPQQKSNELRSLFRLISDAQMAKAVSHLAIRTFEGLSLRDWCRMDIIADSSGVYVIDVNALPGLKFDAKSPSLFPLAFDLCYGQAYEQTILQLVDTAFSRLTNKHPDHLQG